MTVLLLEFEQKINPFARFRTDAIKSWAAQQNVFDDHEIMKLIRTTKSNGFLS